MSGTGVPKNVNFYGSKQADLLKYFQDTIGLELNCHAIGTIQSFNPTNQTAKVTINYQKVVYMDTGGGIWGPVLVSYPVLADCPVRYDFGAQGGFTVPYSQGDEVVIGFNDRDMDLWFTGVLNQGPNTARLHAYADAMVLGGLKSLAHLIQNFDSARPAIRNRAGTSYVAVGPTKIELHGNGTTLNTLLQNLISHIQGITIIAGAVSPASQALLASDATAIGGLLQ